MLYCDEDVQVVLLPDGALLNRADLPAAGPARLERDAKKRVARAVLYGLISESEACRRYALAEADLRRWVGALRETDRPKVRVSFPATAEPQAATSAP